MRVQSLKDENDEDIYVFDDTQEAPTTPAPSSIRQRHSKRLPGVVVAAIDVLLAGVCLCVFALFHHVLPRKLDTPTRVVPRPGVTSAVSAGTVSSSSDGEQLGEQGMFGGKFAGRFSDTVQRTEHSYVSPNIRVDMSRHTMQVGGRDVVYYVADIYVRDIDCFRTAFAGDEYGRSTRENTLQMAQRHGAVVAISGDYYSLRDKGVVIRNGVIYRDTVFEDVCVLYYDGTMETYSPGEFDAARAEQRGAYQAWSFGPMLLQGGKAMTSFNSEVMPANPRSALGYYEPGHYCFVTVDGRQEASAGLRMEALSQLFEELGCQAAYNLDGGQSAIMVFGDQVYNQPAGGGRSISDILYIGEAE